MARNLPVETALNSVSGVMRYDGASVGVPNTTFDLGVIEACIVDYTDPSHPVVVRVDRAASTGETTPFLLTNNITFVGIDKNGALTYKEDLPYTNEESRDIVMLSVVVHIANTVVERVVDRPVVAASGSMQYHDFLRGVSPHKYGRGLAYTANSGLTFARALGALEGMGLGFAAGAQPYKNPNILNLVAEATVGIGPTGTILYVLSDNSAAVAGGGGTLIDSANFESPLGVIAAVGNNKFTVQYVVSFSEGRTNIQYGQTEYQSLDAATDSIAQDPYVIAPVIAGSATVLAAIVIKAGATDLTDPAEVLIKNFGPFGGII